MSKIQAELEKATGLTRKGDEDDAKYFARLIRAAGTIEDKKWAEVSEPSQRWVNDGVAAINSKGKIPIPNFPDAVETAPAAPAAPATATPAAPVTAPVAETAPPPKPEKAPKAPKAPKATAPVAVPAAPAAPAEEEAPIKPRAVTSAAPAAPVTAVAEDNKKRGSIRYFRELLIRSPEKKSKQLVEETVAAGFTLSPSTAYVVYYETINTIKLLRELGMMPAAPATAAPAAA